MVACFDSAKFVVAKMRSVQGYDFVAERCKSPADLTIAAFVHGGQPFLFGIIER